MASKNKFFDATEGVLQATRPVANVCLCPPGRIFTERISKFLLLFSKVCCTILKLPAGVMELVDVVDSKSTDGDIVPVRVRSPAPKYGIPRWGIPYFYAGGQSDANRR